LSFKIIFNILIRLPSWGSGYL